MNYESRLAVETGILSNNDYARIADLLKKFDMPVDLPPGIPRDKIIQKTYSDKKTTDGKVKYVLPKKIGDSVFDIDIEDSVVNKIL